MKKTETDAIKAIKSDFAIISKNIDELFKQVNQIRDSFACNKNGSIDTFQNSSAEFAKLTKEQTEKFEESFDEFYKNVRGRTQLDKNGCIKFYNTIIVVLTDKDGSYIKTLHLNGNSFPLFFNKISTKFIYTYTDAEDTTNTGYYYLEGIVGLKNKSCELDKYFVAKDGFSQKTITLMFRQLQKKR